MNIIQSFITYVLIIWLNFNLDCGQCGTIRWSSTLVTPKILSSVARENNRKKSQQIIQKITNLRNVHRHGRSIDDMQEFYEFLVSKGLTRICLLIREAHIDDVLASVGPFTLFAPTDDAFAFLEGKVLEELENDTAKLQGFITYHLVPGGLTTADFLDDSVVNSALGSPLRFNTYENGNVITVSGSQILEHDLKIGNVIIHVIDHVLYPPPTNNMPNEIRSKYNTMYRLLEEAELTEVLSDKTFTCFVPNDQAFRILPPTIRNALYTNATLLQRILLNHIIPGTFFRAGLPVGFSLQPLDGAPIVFSTKRGLILVNGVPIVVPDITVTNGVIHVINRVLLPPDVLEDCKCLSPAVMATTTAPPLLETEEPGIKIDEKYEDRYFPDMPATNEKLETGPPVIPTIPVSKGTTETPSDSCELTGDCPGQGENECKDADCPAKTPCTGQDCDDVPEICADGICPEASTSAPICPGKYCPEGKPEDKPECPGPDCPEKPGDKPECPGPSCTDDKPECPGPSCPDDKPECPGPSCPDDKLEKPEDKPECPGPSCPDDKPEKPQCPFPYCTENGESGPEKQPECVGDSCPGGIPNTDCPGGSCPDGDNDPECRGEDCLDGCPGGVCPTLVPQSTSTTLKPSTFESRPQKVEPTMATTQNPGLKPSTTDMIKATTIETKGPFHLFDEVEATTKATTEMTRVADKEIEGTSPPKIGSTADFTTKPTLEINEDKKTDKPSDKTTDKPGKETTVKPAEETTDKPGEETTDKPGEETTNKPGEETTDKPSDKTTDKPGEETTDKPSDKTTDKPGEETTDKQSDKTTDKPGEETTDKPGEETTNKPGEETTDKPSDKTTDKPGEETTDKPSDKTTDKPGEETTDKQSDKTTDKPGEETTDKPSDKTTDKPGEETTDKPSDKTTDKPGEETTDKPSDKTTDKPGEETTDKQSDKTTDKPGEETTDKPSDKTTDKPGEETTDKPSDKTTDKPGEETTDKPSDKTTDKTNDEITEKLSEETTGKPSEGPTDKPSEVTTDKPSEGSTDIPSDKTTAKPSDETTVNPSDETTAKPSDKTTVKPSDETTVKPSDETTVKPSDETTVKPSDETTVKPSDETTVKPSDETTVKPSDETTVKQSDETTVKPSDKTTVKPSDETTVKPSDETTVKPSDETTDIPSEGSTDKPTGGLTNKPSDETTDKPSEKSTDKPSDETTDKPNDETTDKPNDETTDKPSEKSTDKPSDETTDKPSDETTDKPNDETTDKPNDETTDKPSDETTEKPTEKSTDKPSDEATDKLSDEATDKPSEKSTDKPSDETTDKPSDETTDKPSDETTDKPSEGSTDKPSDEATDKPSEIFPDKPSDETTEKPKPTYEAAKNPTDKESTEFSLIPREGSTQNTPIETTTTEKPSEASTTEPSDTSTDKPDFEIVSTPATTEEYEEPTTTTPEITEKPPIPQIPELSCPEPGSNRGPTKSVVDFLDQSGLVLNQKPVTFKVVLKLFDNAGLTNVLKRRVPFTLCVPTDEAFTRLSKESLNRLKTDMKKLRKILLYHIISSQLPNYSLRDNSIIKTYQGSNVIINVQNTGKLVLIGGSQVIGFRKTTFGQLYVINKPLTQLPQENLLRAIRERPNLSQFYNFIQSCSLSKTIQGRGPYTIMAPTNDAFRQIPKETLHMIKTNKKTLERLLNNHVVNGARFLQGVNQNRLVPTIQRGKLRFVRSRDQVLINGARIVEPDIATGNGVIQVINKVLLPDIDQSIEYGSEINPRNPILDKLARGLGVDKFINFLTESGVMSQLEDGRSYTIFAPTDTAIASLPPTLLRTLQHNANQMLPIVKYHIVPSTIQFNEISNEMTIATLLSNKDVRFNLYHNDTVLTVSGAPVGPVRMMVGLTLCVVNKVLYPPIGDIAKTVSKSPILQDLTKALKLTGLEEELADMGPYTLFAPTEAAFRNLPKAEYLSLFNDPEKLRDLIRRHLIKGTLFSAGVMDSMTTRSINGGETTLTLRPQCIVVNGVNVLYSDITASNGVVHVLDHLL